MKKTAIAILIAVVVVALGAGLCFAGLSTVNFRFRDLDRTEYIKSTYELSEPFREMDIRSYTADVDIVAGEGDVREVVVFETDREKYTVRVQDGRLVIRPLGEEKGRWDLFDIFRFKGPRITLTLPQAEYASLQAELNTGDLAVRDLSIETVLVNLNTGRAEISNLALKSIVAHSDTGDLLLSDLAPETAELSVNTGDLVLKNVICAGELRCKSTTGNIRLTDVDALSLYLQASTGDITGTIRTPKNFSASASTGKVSVPTGTVSEPNGPFGGPCQARTSTGDIRLSLSGE